MRGQFIDAGWLTGVELARKSAGAFWLSPMLSYNALSQLRRAATATAPSKRKEKKGHRQRSTAQRKRNWKSNLPTGATQPRSRLFCSLSLPLSCLGFETGWLAGWLSIGILRSLSLSLSLLLFCSFRSVHRRVLQSSIWRLLTIFLLHPHLPSRSTPSSIPLPTRLHHIASHRIA